MRWVVSFIFLLNVCFAFAKGDDAFIKLDLPTFESDGVFSTTSRPPNDWWVELNDPILDSLINLAVSNNQDVFVAMDNILAATFSATAHDEFCLFCKKGSKPVTRTFKVLELLNICNFNSFNIRVNMLYKFGDIMSPLRTYIALIVTWHFRQIPTLNIFHSLLERFDYS